MSDRNCVYTFEDGKAEGQAGMKNLLGGKGANLAEMSNLGLPVPPGFTITTEVCMAADPFVTIGQEGVGELVKLAVERGKKTRPNIKLRICGEHGGDPASIHFCEATGLDYVSCSPYRVPIARLAAAQAALGAKAASQA
ncbi:hypothetical protein JO965_29690 (plasmid) [Microvirga sp. VF16]|nr:hypothetical protein JO965_29690 [Microvirga sp. VF16]